MKKDIILIMSDQHNGLYTSMNTEMEDITPNLKRIAEQGCWVEQAYCNSPLCVPSRMSFLTGKLPSETKILNNDSTLNSDEITLAHEIGLEGYETIMVGRMHFKGLDQFHGFDARYVGDITNQYWGMSRDEIKEFHASFNSKNCQNMIGEGDSPIIDFDSKVFKKAYEVLTTPHEKPLFLVIGFYAPHYPYISKQEDIKVESSISEKEISYTYDSVYQSCYQTTTLSQAETINKAYKKMIYTIDKYIGELYHTFKKTSKGLFIYTSDHGDQLGKRSIYGKRTLYEDSIRIPMFIDGITLPNSMSLASLHDVLVSYAKDEPISIKDEHIIVQSILTHQERLLWCEAVIYHGYKLVRLDQEVHLYHLAEDINEQHDIAKSNVDIVKELMTYLSDEEDIHQILEHEYERKNTIKLLNAHGKEKHMVYDKDFHIIDPFIPQDKYEYRKQVINYEAAH